MLLRYANGNELYFRLSDETTNRIHESEWKSRIDYLRSREQGEFIDMEEEPKFRYAKLLYYFLDLISK